MSRQSGRFPILSPPMVTRLISSHRYALTLRIMIANLRRKMGIMPPGMVPPTDPALMVPPFMDPSLVGPPPPHQQQQPITLEELGMPWPNDRGLFSPSAIPLWLQEQVRLSLVLVRTTSIE